jgi:hypothetical protein
MGETLNLPRGRVNLSRKGPLGSSSLAHGCEHVVQPRTGGLAQVADLQVFSRAGMRLP